MMVGRKIDDVFPSLGEKDSGDIIIEGRKKEITSIKSAIKSSIGYIPEDRKAAGIVYFRSVKDNITLANLKAYAKLGFINKLDIKTAGINQRSLSIT